MKSIVLGLALIVLFSIQSSDAFLGRKKGQNQQVTPQIVNNIRSANVNDNNMINGYGHQHHPGHVVEHGYTPTYVHHEPSYYHHHETPVVYESAPVYERHIPVEHHHGGGGAAAASASASAGNGAASASSAAAASGAPRHHVHSRPSHFAHGHHRNHYASPVYAPAPSSCVVPPCHGGLMNFGSHY